MTQISPKQINGLPFDMASYRRYDDGTTPIPYYSFPAGATFSTFSPWPGDTLFCRPFPAGKSGTVASMGMRVTAAAGAGSMARLGIYEDNGNVYPGALVADVGTINIDGTGFLNITGLSVNLEAGKLYWLTHLLTIASGAVTFRVQTPASNLTNFLGLNEAGAQAYTNVQAAFAFGALPANFPVGGTWGTGGLPIIFTGLSAWGNP